ncbi:transposase [Desulfobacter sp. UBA2225]|uniref:transposase n=1 Tax=Desulfobacter sp. UBA2225 TaxID=1961413 RepID=UPI00257A580F|nr:transposase [Desulfobacter sp. UBA2225]
MQPDLSGFKSQIGTWEERGLFLYFIPKYSPQLNLIEILWKHIRYFWLSTSAYNGGQRGAFALPYLADFRLEVKSQKSLIGNFTLLFPW